jgi:hypothetical protein
MAALDHKKVLALESGKTVQLTDAELAELKRWTPPYVELTVTTLGADRNMVSSTCEED